MQAWPSEPWAAEASCRRSQRWPPPANRRISTVDKRGGRIVATARQRRIDARPQFNPRRRARSTNCHAAQARRTCNDHLRRPKRADKEL